MAQQFSQRVRQLLDTMTLEEKAAQLSAYMFFDTFWHTHESYDEQQRIDFIKGISSAEMIGEDGLGFVSTELRDLPPRLAAERANDNQRHIQEITRSRIPVIIQDEGVHGLIGNGATVFPSALAMASSWDVDLFFEVAQVIGREARVRGVRQLLSPTMNLGLDPRCGRVEETYGEDPFLSARMAVSFITGVQSQAVVCTPKHFVANFEGDGGRDSWPVHFSERYLREHIFPPFEASIREAGALSLMSAYGSSDGEPCSASHWLLTEVLRNEWGFDGYVVSDYHSIVHLYELHRTAATKGEAAKQALEAGLDVEFPRIDCYGAPLIEMVRSGKMDEGVVDQACGRVLHVKERIGLLDDCMSDPDEAEAVTNAPEHRELAREMARRSIVLLKNTNGRLPLTNVKKMAVIGPNADSVEIGDYSWDLFTKDHVVTPLEGMKRVAPEGVEIHFHKGCELADARGADLTGAADLARECDVAVLFLGSGIKVAGEARDRQNLDLPGQQKFLIQFILETGTPVVVVLITGGVHTMLPWVDKVDAVLQAWYAGEEGGTALAEILFGLTNPSAKLPITIPRNIGQCPVTYRHKPSGRGHTYDKLGQEGGVLFPFGFGLSYSIFEYSELGMRPPALRQGDMLTVSCRITNRSDRAGAEVVQVYTHDPLASVVRPLKELVAFQRVGLEAGESRVVTFQLAWEKFAFLNRKLEKVVEAGIVQILIGSSCTDVRLKAEVEICR